MKLYVLEIEEEDSDYIIQIGCSREEKEVFEELEQLSKQGYHCWISEYEVERKGFVFFD